MIKSKNIVFVLVFGLCLLFYENQSHAQNAKQLDAKMTEIIRSDAAAGTATVDWHNEQDALIEELRLLKIEKQWLELQTKKVSHYLESTNKEIADLEETNSNYAIIELQLESMMWDYYDELVQGINSDLPFLTEERASRLVFIKESLDDPDLSVGEKFRRFTEALNVEASYGTDLKVDLEKASFEGKDTDLIIVRLGRIGLYAITLDMTQSGIWNYKQNTFKKSTEENHKYIIALQEIVNNKRFQQLEIIPVMEAK